MKAVILAGGFGSRMAELTELKPKPMVEVGGRPLLWHIMKSYAHHGIREFIVCLGYKGHVIKEYFANYRRYVSDLVIELKTGEELLVTNNAEDWKVTLVETGQETMTGGRLRRVASLIGDETFCMTYGDGLADINVSAELAFHRSHGRLATVAAVTPPGRFGAIEADSKGMVTRFAEKQRDELALINGGFFVLEPGVIPYIDGDDTSWEREPMERLALAGQLMAFRHSGFWKPCDMLRDKRDLDKLWAAGSAPWALWLRS